ncbi:MAG: PQQ-binding-like beta-propeller repeat protein [Verrucomicrobiota bacterium]|jgi:outer membrane protein assembly factor BamB
MSVYLKATCIGLVASTAVALANTSWPQWRGPSRDGRTEAAPWPASLDEQHLRLRWRVELGPSYSGPIVTPDRVFTTETRDARMEVVRALDRATGKELWKSEWEGAMKVPFFAKANGDWIRSTPTWDGESLYVSGMRDVLVCIDAGNGNVRWKHDFPAEDGTAVPAFGYVSSPLVDGDALYTQAGGAVVRLDKRSGKVQWKALSTTDSMNGSAFSSPIVADLAGQRQLIVQTRTHLAGLDLASGKELWSTPVEAFRGMNILTPAIVSSNRLFTSTYGGKTLAFDVAREGDRFSVKPAWSFKAQGYMTSPILHDGHAYLHLRNQRALCVSLSDGAEKWTSTESFGKYWSLVANRDRILALDERGVLLLLNATPSKPDVLARRQVGDDTWAHLAVAGQDVFIRELKALAAYEWSEPKP